MNKRFTIFRHFVFDVDVTGEFLRTQRVRSVRLELDISALVAARRRFDFDLSMIYKEFYYISA